MTATSTTTALETRWLTAPISRRNVREFMRTFAGRNPSIRNRRDGARRVVVGIGIAAGVIGLLAMLFGVTEEIREQNDDMAGQLTGMAMVVLLMFTAAAISIWFYVRSRVRRGTPARHYRFANFAADNGMTYLPGPYRGTHVSPWRDRGSLVVTRVIRTGAGRSVEFANYELQSGPPTARETQLGGYCAVRLNVRLPHIVLESTEHRLSQLTALAVPERAQRLRLEGDFDRHYALYCPKGYERDALYLFTPDIMARLIDRVHDFDIEIVDDWLLLTRGGDVVTLDPATWQGIATAIDALGGKIARWERWRDDRTAGEFSVFVASDAPPRVAAAVAAPGRRLQMTGSRAGVLWIVLGVVAIGAVVVAGTIGR